MLYIPRRRHLAMSGLSHLANTSSTRRATTASSAIHLTVALLAAVPQTGISSSISQLDPATEAPSLNSSFSQYLRTPDI